MHTHLLKAGSLTDPGAQSFARLNLLVSAWHLAISVPLPQALGIWNTTPYLSEARPLTWFLHGGWGFKLRFTPTEASPSPKFNIVDEWKASDIMGHYKSI